MVSFLFGSMLYWTHFLKSKRFYQAILALLLASLSLFSKSSAVLFLVFLVPASAFLQGQWKNKHQLYFLIPTALYLLVRESVLAGAPEPNVVNNALVYQESFWANKAMSFDLFLRYCMKVIYPSSLSWDYSFNQIPLHGWESTYTWIGLFLFLAFPIAAYLARIKKPVISLGLLLFWFGVLLYIQLFLLLEVTFAERFLFLPVLGFVLVVFGLIPKGNVRFFSAVFLSAIFGFMSVQRAADWKDNATLYAADIEKVPNSIRANTAYAYTLYEQAIQILDATVQKEKIEQSNEYYRKAINIYGKDANTWFNYGMNNLTIGEYTMAEQAFKSAISYRPDHTSAYNNLGNIEYLKGQQGNAKNYYALAVKADNTNAEAWSNLGAVYLLFKQNDSAYLALSKATQLNPKHENAQYNLDVVKKRLGIQP